MRCQVVLRHRPLNRREARKKFKEVFAAPSLPPSRHHLVSEQFRGQPEFNSQVLYYNRLPDVFFSFMCLDSRSTQIWAEATTGRETFSSLERVVDNGIRVIKESQAKRKKCNIESSRIFEQEDTESLELALEEISLLTEIRSVIRFYHFYFLIFTWGIGALVGFLITPVEGKKWTLLLQPAMFAPGGAILAGFSKILYNVCRRRKRVRIRVKE